MRLFIAVNFDSTVKNKIIVTQNHIREKTAKGRFTAPENLHLTLAFLGETAEDRVPEIQEAIKQSVLVEEPAVKPFSLVFSKAGFFKRGGKELWHLGLAEDNSGGEVILKKLQRRLTKELLDRGFYIDKRPFTAHITLGREIQYGTGGGLWPFETEKIIIPVKRISLMLSLHTRDHDKKNKLSYTELFGFDLARENIQPQYFCI